MAWNSVQHGRNKHCDEQAPTRALFVSEVRQDLSDHPKSKSPIRTPLLPLFEILSIFFFFFFFLNQVYRPYT
jgi:hypothetical protein